MGPDLVGYVASGLVLLTFTAKSMLTLRILTNLKQFRVYLLWNHRFHCPGSVPTRDFTTA
jgi:hypothetical protein